LKKLSLKIGSTFSDDGELICGTLLTKDSWEKLNINPHERKKYKIFPFGREKYLEWHRRNIFRN
jgi:putative restriction endonuclease